MNKREHLVEKICFIEKQMSLRLQEIRRDFEHMGNRGSIVESVFRDFLRMYLPRRLSVGTGEIIDRSFNTTNQIDLVVTDENHPLTYGNNEPGLFFIEGTCASGEIKSVLTTEQLIDGLDKASNYKNLKMIAPAGALMYAPSQSDGNRFYTTPPFFIFAFESQITIEKILEEVRKYKQDCYAPGFSADGVFVLDKGYVIDLGDGMGTLKIYDDSKKSGSGWQGFRSSKTLFDFLSWLSAVMPRMVGGSNILTPYLIELNKYSKSAD